MVHLMCWSDYELAGMYRADYFDVYRGQTPMWYRFVEPACNLIRYPDLLVYQGGDW